MAKTLDLSGGCYCGAIRYRVQGEPIFKAQCHCRECQYITGGGPNIFVIMPQAGYSWTQGTPRRFARADLETPVTRTFCETCGTHLSTELPDGKRVVVKVGTLDDPTAWGAPKAAIFMADSQPYHVVPDGIPAFDRMP